MSSSLSEDERICARHHAELSGSIYAILFLFVTTYGLDRAFVVYLDRLVRGNQISRWSFLIGYAYSGMAVIFLTELLIVVCWYRLGPLRMTLQEMGLTFSVPKLKELVWGLLAGLLTYAGSLPIILILRVDQHSGLTDLIITDFYHPKIVFVLILFVVLLPISSEIVYRGIIFKSFLESSGVVPAVLLSGFAFGFVWPIYNSLVGLLLGFATALLYYRFHNVLPAIVANAVVTVSCAATLVCRRLS